MTVPEQLLGDRLDLRMQGGQPGITEDRAACTLALRWITNDEVAISDVPPSPG
jgi:hypothetical protein